MWESVLTNEYPATFATSCGPHECCVLIIRTTQTNRHTQRYTAMQTKHIKTHQVHTTSNKPPTHNTHTPPTTDTTTIYTPRCQKLVLTLTKNEITPQTTHITTKHTTPCFHNHKNTLHTTTMTNNTTQLHTTTQTRAHRHNTKQIRRDTPLNTSRQKSIQNAAHRTTQPHKHRKNQARKKQHTDHAQSQTTTHTTTTHMQTTVIIFQETPSSHCVFRANQSSTRTWLKEGISAVMWV